MPTSHEYLYRQVRVCFQSLTCNYPPRVNTCILSAVFIFPKFYSVFFFVIDTYRCSIFLKIMFSMTDVLSIKFCSTLPRNDHITGVIKVKTDFRCCTILVTLSPSLLIVASQIKIQSTLNCCYDNLSISYLYFT